MPPEPCYNCGKPKGNDFAQLCPECREEFSVFIEEEAMSCHSREELENMLEDVVNVLDLSDAAIAEHGPLGTPPAELVRLVIDQKDKTIRNLRAGMVECN
jgi:hypothetical protein